MNRTIRLALRPTPEHTAALSETAAQFSLAFNSVCAVGWAARLSTTAGCITIRFLLPRHHAKNVGGRTLTADLIPKKGRWFLHASVDLPDAQPVESRMAHGTLPGSTLPAVACLPQACLSQRAYRWAILHRQAAPLQRAVVDSFPPCIITKWTIACVRSSHACYDAILGLGLMSILRFASSTDWRIARLK